MSREHYISDGIFDGTSVTTYGLPWFGDSPRTIGLKSAVAKILCGKHNSALSKFDSEASKLSRFLTRSVLDQPIVEHTITLRGVLLEKWALKTFLNLGYLGALHREQPNEINPPESLVHHIFHDDPIAEGIGLYFVSGKIANEGFEAGLSWNVIQNRDEMHQVFGMAMVFYGVRFVVSIAPIRAEEKIAQVGVVNGFDYSAAKVLYRVPSIILQSNVAARKQIHLLW